MGERRLPAIPPALPTNSTKMRCRTGSRISSGERAAAMRSRWPGDEARWIPAAPPPWEGQRAPGEARLGILRPIRRGVAPPLQQGRSEIAPAARRAGHSLAAHRAVDESTTSRRPSTARARSTGVQIQPDTRRPERTGPGPARRPAPPETRGPLFRRKASVEAAESRTIRQFRSTLIRCSRLRGRRRSGSIGSKSSTTVWLPPESRAWSVVSAVPSPPPHCRSHRRAA